MLMADDGSDFRTINELPEGADANVSNWDSSMCLDIDKLWEVLGECPPDSSQYEGEDLSLNNVTQGQESYAFGDTEQLPPGSLGVGSPELFTQFTLRDPETSYFRTGILDGSLNSTHDSVVSDNVKLEPTVIDTSAVHCNRRNHLDSRMSTQGCNSFILDMDGVAQDASFRKDEYKEYREDIPKSSITCRFVAGYNYQIPDSLPNKLSENCDNNAREKFFDLNQNGLATLEIPKMEDMHTMDLNISSQSASQTCSIYCGDSDNLCKSEYDDSIMQHCLSSDDLFYSYPMRQFHSNFSHENDGDNMFNIKDEEKDFPTHFKYFGTRINDEPVVERTSETVIEPPVIGSLNMRGSSNGSKGGGHLSLSSGEVSLEVNYDYSLKIDVEEPFSHDMLRFSSEKDDVDGLQVYEAPSLQSPCSIRSCIGSIKEASDSKLMTTSQFSKTTHQEVQSNELALRYNDDSDSDLCIIEDFSDPARCNVRSLNGKSVGPSQQSLSSGVVNHRVGVGTRLKSNERSIFNVALQDLSQPKSEAYPPDGLLAVTLLRHQRIALSWMVQKETNNAHCLGGILADDQGLGKTISTIALLLRERAPCSSLNKMIKQSQMEMLNLDEDEDDEIMPKPISCSFQVNQSSVKQGSTSQGKGRLAAGTLIVCPTSVLRQWSDELHNKVTRKANLSVLVYHGSNRTKDPLELTKHDVVLTTYSIVSLEVPKQPVVDDDCDENGGVQGNAAAMGLSYGKKRKYSSCYTKKCLKGRKGVDGELQEAVFRPLSRVSWFRVVLDEAQSIKNHRTQVARACWGLRAKRRWCLSGTPIQNAVDDLYSYFRFLRYEPYSVYKSFCSSIKVPIHRNPTNGYKKLQAVLKTFMLRRTKGTLLDGEPIVNLPPKTVELKKVDFTLEERDFYCRLEADSRAQFVEYAAAGTVKQNYVNILLMLLRLRQACDHPLLVSGYNSNSYWKSSADITKKIPSEKLICLLNCLETSLAICGLCSDPPEDAVVASCQHVFCNQCISEHLTGDDNQCPMTNCKAQITASSLFSRATLRSALADQSGPERASTSSGYDLAERFDSCFSDGSYDSSKIKAALEVLQSLSRPHGHTPGTTENISSASQTSSSPPSGRFNCDVNDSRDFGLKKASSDLVTIAGEKAIVFSQWTGMLDLLEACLKNTSINYRRLDGTMSIVARDKAVKDFNNLPEVSVMIMSLKAASLGLNMVAACHVLLLDLWWNPTTEDQAIDRAHRIGQTRPVTVLRLTVKDTVEDRILALQQRKREMVASAFGEDETGGRQTRLTVEDLQYLFKV